MAVLDRLARRAPEVIARQALIDDVWAGESGGDESLSRAVSLLRKAFGDRRGSHAHIETIPRTGYRLVAKVEPLTDEPRPAAPARRLSTAAWMGLVTVLTLAGVGTWLSGTDRASSERGAPAASSVAVLPFTDMSPDQDQRY